jgi:hypothetical protein
MEVLGELDVSPREAVRMMTDFTTDSFLAERDPDLANSVKRVLANLAITAYEIAPSGPPDQPEPPAAHLEAPRRRRRRHTQNVGSP